MKILLTLDLNQPASEERTLAESLINWLWDQLQVTGLSVEVLMAPPESLSPLQWVSQPSVLKKYKSLASSPLTSYDLIIGVDLSVGAEAFFTSLGIRTLIVRAIPCPGFSRFLLVRANVELSPETATPLPSLKNLFLKKFPPIDDTSPSHRHWWLGNQYLLRQQRTDPLTLCIGTSLFQPERIRSGSLTNLSTYADVLLPLLGTSPHFYYFPRPFCDPSEGRFMKRLGAGPASLSLTELLARDELDFFISIDSGLVPIAEAFKKKIFILGTQPVWTTRKLRQFCDRSFIEKLATASFC